MNTQNHKLLLSGGLLLLGILACNISNAPNESTNTEGIERPTSQPTLPPPSSDQGSTLPTDTPIPSPPSTAASSTLIPTITPSALVVAEPESIPLIPAIVSFPELLILRQDFDHVLEEFIKIPQPPPPEDCSQEKIDEVLEGAHLDFTADPNNPADKTYVIIDCNLDLPAGVTITKRLIFEGPDASGVTLNCTLGGLNGYQTTLDGGKDEGRLNYKKEMIEVRSSTKFENGVRVWLPAKNVTINNCHIIGRVRIWGMTKAGQGRDHKDGPNGEMINYFKESSRGDSTHMDFPWEEHTQRARNNAPSNIVFNHVLITGVGTPLYFGPGVHHSMLINSEIGGDGAVGIYLDTESYSNTIKGNYIHVETENHFMEFADRPLIAIDGSSYNKIMNNRFEKTSHGGIFLYRNCGEGGVVRHSTPSHNQIINNIFYYDKYTGGNPAIFIGSHNRGWLNRQDLHKSQFCDDDDGYDFGSSVSDKDLATYNVVMQNQIIKRSVKDMIVVNSSCSASCQVVKFVVCITPPWGGCGGQGENLNSPNFINYNHSVSADEVVYNGLAVCYIPEEIQSHKDFLKHGQVMTNIIKDDNGNPTCSDEQYTCNDGDLLSAPNANCEITSVPFECSVNGDNGGCNQGAFCPAGQRIVAASAACNLESGTITDDILASVPVNTIRVVRASDKVSSGKCNVGSYSVREGEKDITELEGSYGGSIGCKEHDQNGGDCHIKGVLYCQ